MKYEKEFGVTAQQIKKEVQQMMLEKTRHSLWGQLTEPKHQMMVKLQE